MQSYVILASILLLSYIGHNNSVLYATVFVLLIKLTGLTQLMDLVASKGISWGIIILTVAILMPIAQEKIGLTDITQCFQSIPGVVALLMGILVAISGHYGVDVLKASPEIVSALIIGTMIGVFFFKGIAVGPLIAAGAVYWFLEFWKKLFG